MPARLDSLIECAKANGLEPYASLRHVFTELPKAQSLEEVEALLSTRFISAVLARAPLPTPSFTPPHLVNNAFHRALTSIRRPAPARTSTKAENR